MTTDSYKQNFNWEIEQNMAAMAKFAAQQPDPHSAFGDIVKAVSENKPEILNTQGKASYAKYMAGFSLKQLNNT